MDLSRWETDMERMAEDFFGRRTRPWWPERWLRTEGMEVQPLRWLTFMKRRMTSSSKPSCRASTKNNIEVNLTDHTLTIKGEKKKEEEVKEENYYRLERSYGSFIRTLELPKDVHTDKVKASFKDGILEVRLPKTEEAKAKEVKVKVD